MDETNAKKVSEAGKGCILTLNNLYTNRATLYRFTDREIPADTPIALNFSRTVLKKRDGTYVVDLTARASNGEYFEALVRLTGNFSLHPAEDNNKEDLSTVVSMSTIAVMFPYLRSKMTELTTDFGSAGVIIPVMNIESQFSKIPLEEILSFEGDCKDEDASENPEE
ncbi:MAG: hypothetical protein NC548_28435 [Lachnospiraceae bacterium]|nr:hypothetical protein [Lachnospiraceae bacterium]MCM1232020.1 hypothetical protein [Ruminococcus flavefaciens]